MALFNVINDILIPSTENYDQSLKMRSENRDLLKARKMEEDRRRSIANKALFISSPHSSLGSTLFIKDFAFALKLDLQHFKPEEIKVSIRQGTLTVEVKHKEWLGGYGVLGQNVVLRLNTLPGNVAIDKAEIRLSRDGMLSISISKDRSKNGF